MPRDVLPEDRAAAFAYKFESVVPFIKTAAPIKALNSIWRGYERRLIHDYLAPLLRRMRDTIRQTGREYESIRQAIRAIPDPDPALKGKARAAAVEAARKTKEHHTRRFRVTMSKLLGISREKVGPMVPEVEDVISRFIQANVDLIVTLDERAKTRFAQEMLKLARTEPFDQDAIEQYLRRQEEISGYQLRRIVRDQSQKLSSQFDRVRQMGVGIQEYKWVTAGDERVRESHRRNNGKVFRWDTPPVEGHPGDAIQCRCVAAAVIPT